MRYYVISYDDDEQQTFFDMVECGDHPDEAKAIIGEIRPYAIPCDALTAEDLESLHNHILTRPSEKIAEWLAEVRKESGIDEDDEG